MEWKMEVRVKKRRLPIRFRQPTGKGGETFNRVKSRQILVQSSISQNSSVSMISL